MDLVEVKPRIQRELWLNLYADGSAAPRQTKAEANWSAQDEILACVKIAIDCEEGEGLEDGE